MFGNDVSSLVAECKSRDESQNVRRYEEVQQPAASPLNCTIVSALCRDPDRPFRRRPLVRLRAGMTITTLLRQLRQWVVTKVSRLH